MKTAIPLLLTITLFLPQLAWGRVYDTYRADRFKGAFCAVIGGACVADVDIVTALFLNPAALATGNPSWDFDGDYSSKSHVEPGMGSNNSVSETAAVAGYGYSWGKWGLGLGVTFQQTKTASDLTAYDSSGNPIATGLEVKARTVQYRLPVAYQLDDRLSLGATITLTYYHQDLDLKGSDPYVVSPARTKLGLSLGALYSATNRLRLGSWLKLPMVIYEPLRFSTTLSSALVSYSEDMELKSPWILATGAQYLASPSWQLYLEGDVIGATPHGYLLAYNSFNSAVTDATLIDKGRKIVLEPHWGTRIGLTKKVRMHLGGYYETSRWEDLPGRLHSTGGISYDTPIFEFIAGLDVAKKYTQLVFTFR